MHKDINVNVSGPVQPTSTYKTVVLKGQAPFAAQVTKPNMKYVIKHNFVLDGDVTIPANCVLEFDGGSVSGYSLDVNGGLLCGNEISSSGVVYNYYKKQNYVSLTWFYKNSDTDYSAALERAIELAHILNKKIYIPKGTYTIHGVTIPYSNIVIEGESINNSIIYNPTWGDWTIRCLEDKLQISNCSFTAIDHKTTKFIIRTPDIEFSNSPSAIIYKGNHGRFFDLHFEEIEYSICLGGDYLNSSVQLYDNICHDITFKNVAMGILALQQSNATWYNLSGSFTTFNGVYERDDTPRNGAPGHIIYCSSNNIEGSFNKFSYDLDIHDIYGEDNGDNVASTVISVRCAKRLNINSIQAYKCGAIMLESATEAVVEDVVCREPRLQYAVEFASYYHPLTDTDYGLDKFAVRANNISIMGGCASLRVSNTCVAYISNVYLEYVSGYISGNGLFSANGAKCVVADGVKCVGNFTSYSFINAIGIIKNNLTINPTFSGIGNVTYYTNEPVANKRLFAAVISVMDELKEYLNPIVSPNVITLPDTISGDRNNIDYTEVSCNQIVINPNGKQILFNGLQTAEAAYKRIFCINNGASNFNVRFPDVTKNLYSNITYSSSTGNGLAAGSACIYEIITSANNISIVRTDLPKRV